ncbi:YisL family protein [Robertmurraya andreesenii]|uniref:UPF0344 protein J2S07_000137 n=1 Tax=Anoxybacillus andreesenii TaxID=1325932 RepID=A0ABT9UYR8_9BACL|nr:YisL family protein [Robertmurraya andreesenii]MDQ0153839.1 membrane protein insertase Oxa1/YidC/SpoIIIJ [Robertmurraya andreesenii]
MTASTHLHITTWVITLILFFVAVGLQKSGNLKAQKIVHMILRLFYLLTFATGGMLVHLMFSSYPVQYVLKVIFGILVIGFMEMVLARMKKEKKSSIIWILFIVSLVIVLYLGFYLPLGFRI